MKIITPEKRKGPNYLTCCIFGVSGQGKTSCVTALPREGDTWVAPDGSPGKFIYVAADKTSPSLASVHPDDRDRAIVVIPDGNVKRGPGGSLVTDWRKEMAQICQTPWKEKYPDAVAIVYDAVTPHAESILSENFKMGYFNPEGPQSGMVDPSGKTKGEYQRTIAQIKEEIVKLGDRGDYRMVQAFVNEQLDWLKDINSNMHVFCVFHTCMGDKEGSAGVIFGPSTVGGKGPRQVPQKFGTVLWLEREDGARGPAGHVRIALRTLDKHIAKVATYRMTDVPEAKWIPPDPNEYRNFWLWLQEIQSS